TDQRLRAVFGPRAHWTVLEEDRLAPRADQLSAAPSPAAAVRAEAVARDYGDAAEPPGGAGWLPAVCGGSALRADGWRQVRAEPGRRLAGAGLLGPGLLQPGRRAVRAGRVVHRRARYCASGRAGDDHGEDPDPV